MRREYLDTKPRVTVAQISIVPNDESNGLSGRPTTDKKLYEYVPVKILAELSRRRRCSAETPAPSIVRCDGGLIQKLKIVRTVYRSEKCASTDQGGRSQCPRIERFPTDFMPSVLGGSASPPERPIVPSVASIS
jgi:hypothetical protein